MKFLVTTFSVLLKTKVVITSFGGLPPLLRRYLYNNKHIQHVHIGHGKTLLKNSGFLTDYLSAKEYNKFVVASDLEKEIFINNGWHENNIIKAGLPRWDLLENNKTKDRSIFFMVTWRQSFKRMYEKKYVGNMQESDYIKKISSFLSSELLMNLMEKHKVTFFFSLHHSIIKQVQDFPGFTMNPYVKFIRSTSISRCVQSCGMFITDYSSVAFDFLFLDKPVIFYRPDYFDYNLLSIDRYDMENAKKYDDLLFNIFYDDKGLFDKIEYYINNGFCLEDIYKTKSKIFFDRKKDIRGKIVEMLEYTVT
jgi:CDP-glycerol glycerophosphotransferase (TagB/SpsB family)